MKKKMNFLTVLVIFIAGVIVISIIMNIFGVSAFGMFVERPDVKDIDSEQLTQIKQSYLDMKMKTGYPDYMTTDDVYVEEYCGSYNGCVVMMLSDNEAIYTQAIRDVTVAGVSIRYSNANELYAWKDGEIYTLEQAYTSGILTKSDIKKIRNIHYQY